MSSPVELWKEIIGEVCGGSDFAPHDQSVEEGDIDADVYGFQHGNGEGDPCPDVLYQYWPQMRTEGGYGSGEPIAATNEWRPGRENQFRVGVGKKVRGSRWIQVMRIAQ